jgi:hypothetical protein
MSAPFMAQSVVYVLYIHTDGNCMFMFLIYTIFSVNFSTINKHMKLKNKK